MEDSTHAASRRRFLQHLAASPLAAGGFGLALGPAWAQTAGGAALITEAGQALNVFQLQAVAAKTMRPAHYGYLQTGVLDDRTVEANRHGFDRWGIRARRLIDVSKVDLSLKLFGQTWASPIMLAPVSAQRAFHQDGERPVARAAKARDALMTVSTLASVSLETVISDRERPVWFQLYPTNDLAMTKRLVQRADKAGVGAVVLTVDLPAGGMRRETQQLLARQDGLERCGGCHNRAEGFQDQVRRKGMFDIWDLGGATALNNATLTWDVIARIREWTGKRVLVKGIMTAEDAELAVKAGVDGMIVSNHGGRAEESLVGTLDVLPEVVQAVGGKVPVLIDGGFRRGTDAFKALALGASAVCIGRPYIWGASAFGQAGVEAAMRLMDQERSRPCNKRA